MDIFFSWQCK